MKHEWIRSTIGEQATLQRGIDITKVEQNPGNSSMSLSEWKSMQLKEFVTLQRGHDLTDKERRPGNVPVYGSFGMNGYHNVSKAKGPGVTVGRSGASFGVVNYSPIDFWPHNTALYVIDFHGNNERFAYYYLRNLDFTGYNSGSAQGSLNRNYIHPIEVKIPPLPTQRAIAHILGTLDDKIELNRKMNETLEAVAQAIFKSWFVDFDPVRAKMDGKQPVGMDAETAALFPSEFEMVDGREVPKGWEIESLSSSFRITMGQSPPGTTYNEIGEGAPFYQGRTDFGFRFPSVRIYCSSPTRFAEVGDTLVSVRAPVGDVNMAQEKCCIGRGVAAVRHKTGSRSFTYYQMLSFKEKFEVFESEGTVFGSIGKTDFNSIECITPPPMVIKRFEDLIFPIDQTIENNEVESQTLITLRDSLLPKLLSGEIWVTNIPV